MYRILKFIVIYWFLIKIWCYTKVNIKDYEINLSKILRSKTDLEYAAYQKRKFEILKNINGLELIRVELEQELNK